MWEARSRSSRSLQPLCAIFSHSIIASVAFILKMTNFIRVLIEKLVVPFHLCFFSCLINIQFFNFFWQLAVSAGVA